MGMQHNSLVAIVLMVAFGALAGCDSGAPAGNGQAADPAGGRPVAPETVPPETGPEQAESAGRAVIAEMLPYAEVGEQLVYGYFAFPEDMVDPLPGILVIHERWGLDDGTRMLAERLAAQGYVVLAVDLYGGNTAANAEEARRLMLPLVEDPEPANDNIRQAYQFLIESGQAPRIAAIGWSFGGNWALNAALLFPDELDAAVIYYGQVTNNEERLAPLNVPLLGLFGENDRGVTPETVNGFGQALENLGKDFRIEIYPGAGHAFADPTGTNFNPEVARQAWNETLEFLDEHLANGER